MKKENRAKYPWNWTQISANVRFGRAKDRCETCGLKAGTIIERLRNGRYRTAPVQEVNDNYHQARIKNISILEQLKRNKLTLVILTVAHLDHNPSNNVDSNLKCLCQYHHLEIDREDNLLRIKNNKTIVQTVLKLF